MATDYLPTPNDVVGWTPDPTSPPGVAFSTTDALPYIAFDGGSTVESVRCRARIPTTFGSSPQMVALVSNSTSSTNNVVLQCQISKVDPDTDTDDMSGAMTFDTTNASTATAMVGTRRLVSITISLSNFDSAVAGDLLAIRVFRDPTHGSDNNTEDCRVYWLEFPYTTA